LEFKTFKTAYRQEFDKKVNELLNEDWTMIGTPKALQESYKEDSRVYNQIVFICFMQREEKDYIS